jgi:cytochrome c-type biogenesis protein CcmH
LLRPPFDVQTLLLWLTPALVLVVGAVVAVTRFRRPMASAPTLSGNEEEHLARILRDDG